MLCTVYAMPLIICHRTASSAQQIPFENVGLRYFPLPMQLEKGLQHSQELTGLKAVSRLLVQKLPANTQASPCTLRLRSVRLRGAKGINDNSTQLMGIVLFNWEHPTKEQTTLVKEVQLN